MIFGFMLDDLATYTLRAFMAGKRFVVHDFCVFFRGPFRSGFRYSSAEILILE